MNREGIKEVNTEELIEKLTLINAIKYNGTASSKSILGALIQTNPDEFKNRIIEIRELIQKTVDKVNKMSIEQQKERLLYLEPESLFEKKKHKKEVKIELRNIDRFDEVVLRLAPFPSGPLHIGNSRMVVLNDYCAKKYNGKLLLVFDDTIGSEAKVIDPEAYDTILEGLDYLGVKIHNIYYKSDRLKLFYTYAEAIIKKNKAYVCTCEGIYWRIHYKNNMNQCPCRQKSVEENLDLWNKMLDGTIPEKGAVVRLKTEMDLPDPAIRDPVMLRISEKYHPRVGSKYRVWPLLEFSWGIDDHELNISHIIRGKDLKKEGIIEEKIWDIFNWKKPTISLYGRMKLKNLQLSKSKSAQLIKEGKYQTWSDPRTWSLQSLQRRGIKAQSIHKALLAFGLNPVDVTFSPEHLYSSNRSLIDGTAKRYFGILNPIQLNISEVPKTYIAANAFIHPEYPERGKRTIILDREDTKIFVYLPKEEIKPYKEKDLIRLKDLFNIIELKIDNGENFGIAKFHSDKIEIARKAKALIVQWVPISSAIPIEILMPTGEVLKGFSEPDLKKAKQGDIIQFERVAFCRIENIGKIVNLIWTHQ